MKKNIIVLSMILILIVGCSDNTVTNNEISSKPAENSIITEQEKQTKGQYIFENKEENQNAIKSKVIINTYFEEPDSMKDKSTRVLNGLMGGEFIEVIVEGEIKDFKHIELVWDEKQNALIEKGIINKLDQLANQTIVIKTYMPDGIPSEKLVWKTISGESNEFVIRNDSKEEKK